MRPSRQQLGIPPAPSRFTTAGFSQRRNVARSFMAARRWLPESAFQSSVRPLRHAFPLSHGSILLACGSMPYSRCLFRHPAPLGDESPSYVTTPHKWGLGQAGSQRKSQEQVGTYSFSKAAFRLIAETSHFNTAGFSQRRHVAGPFMAARRLLSQPPSRSALPYHG